jgi:putative aldouronate transport system substrate-binding protein
MKVRRITFCISGMAALLAILLLLVSAGSGERSSAQSGQSARKNIVVSVYDRGAVPAASGTIENNRFSRWINDNGPVNVTFIAIPRNSPAEKINVLFASGTAPDLVFEYSPGIKRPLYDQGMLMPLDDLIERYSTVYKAFLAKTPSVRKAGTMPDGKMYEFGKTNLATTQRTIFVRQDWLDRLNLKVPDTIEEFFDVAKAFTERDPNGSGVRDTYGIAFSSNSGHDGTLGEIFQASHSNHVLVNNQYVNAWDQRQVYHEFVKRCFDEGIIDRDYLSDTTGSIANQTFLSGKAGILPLNVGGMGPTQMATLKQNQPNAKLTAIPYPRTRFGRVNPHVENPVQMTAIMNADCKEPEAVIKYVDFISSYDAYIALYFGTEGRDYQVEAGMPIRTASAMSENFSAYTPDYTMLVPQSAKDPVTSRIMNYNLSDPIHREVFELRHQTYMNFDFNLPFACISHAEHLPQLPEDLAVLNANLVIKDFYNRAVVSGPSYTVEMASRDAKAAWERGGGNQIDAWFAQWYQTNRNSAFLYPDIYEIMKQQDLIHWYNW